VNGVEIRGTLFTPKGSGRYPGIIDIFGALGGCFEYRAALLAKRGFAALALAYIEYEDLKAEALIDVQIDYFDAAVEWMRQQDNVNR
jgi:dienelactone hydrolase